MKHIVPVFIFLMAMAPFFQGCGDKPVPKPHAYFRISFPEKSYRMLDSIYPYRFEIPTYAKVVHDPRSQDEPFWINIQVPENKADIHISYYRIGQPEKLKPEGRAMKNLPQLIEDAREFVDKHTVKADAIDEQVFLNPQKKVFGTLYYIGGNVASPMQFFLTDSTSNFLRGALYIREIPNIDSLKPVIEFLKTDLIRLIESTSWKN